MSIISAQAKAIAEGAVLSAESARVEATNIANSALSEAATLRKEFEEKASEMDDALTSATSEMKETKEELQKNIAELEKDLEPLATWPDAENPTGIAGFVAKADENSATIGTLVTQQSETSNALAGFKQEVSDKYATIESVSSFETETSKSIAGVKEIADANKAQIDAMVAYDKDGKSALAGITTYVDENSAQIRQLASYEQKDANGAILNSGAAGLIAQVEANKSSIDLLVSFEGDVYEGLAGLTAQVDANKSSVEVLSKRVQGKYESIDSWNERDKDQNLVYYVKAKSDSEDDLWYYYKDGAWRSTTDAYVAGLPASIAGIQAETDEHGATINALTTWQGDTNTAMASIKQKADANGASIQLLTTNLDKYSVGPYSQAYGFTLEQAASVLEEGMVYVPTPHADSDTHSEVYEYVEIGEDGKEVVKTFPDNDGYQFTPGYIYTWSDIDDSPNTTTMMWKESVGKVVEFKSAPSGTSYDFWYKNGGDNSDGYETDTLYKLDTYTHENGGTLTRWIAVATLKGNFSNRAVSQIRQDANSINLEVTNTKGDLAGIKAWAGEDFTAIQDTVSWKNNNSEAIATTIERASDAEAYIAQVASVKNEDGTINATASIVAAINEDGSSVGINADRIVMTGTTAFLQPGDLGENGATVIHGGRIDSNTLYVNAANVSGKLTADQIDASKLEVDAANVTGKLTSNQIDAAGLSADKINVVDDDGNTIFSADVQSKQVNMFAACITGKLTADQIDATELEVDAANVNGKLTADKIDATELHVDAANVDGRLTAEQIDATELEVDAANITGKLTADQIDASKLRVDAANVDGRLTAEQIDATDLKVDVANITGILYASDIVVSGDKTVADALDSTLVSSDIYYALSTSTKVPPDDDLWSKDAPEKERRKYMWQKTVNVYGDGSSEERIVCIAGADGEGSVFVDITSSAGTIYINGDIKTTLVAKAYQDNQDITDEFPDGAFLWEKYDMYGVKDTVWSYTGKAVAVNNLDIYKRAMFNCVLDVDQRLQKEDIE
jgi:hypothetical protein